MGGPYRCVCGFDAGEVTLHPDSFVVCAGCGQPVPFAPPGAEEDGITRDFDPALSDPSAFHLDPVGSTVEPGNPPSNTPARSRSRVVVLPVVPGFEILGELGRGGMGIVYKARQTTLNRIVALKMILAGAHASDVDRERFRKEAAAVAALQHPGIVQIYEIGEQAGQPYLALEYVEGGSLAQKLAALVDLMPVRDCARVVERLSRSMHHAHALGVVHRDLKPANVLLSGPVDRTSEKATPSGSSPKSGIRATESTPKITDFGLAKRLDETLGSGATKTGAVMGTPSYIAPEQASGRSSKITPLADVYSLGAILYEMLTGRPPFKGDTPLDTVLQVIHDDPIAPSRLRPKLPRDLETICLKCLTKDPLKRYASAEALADDLGRFQRREAILARPQSSAMRGFKWARRHPAISVFALMAILGVVTVVSVLATAYADVREAVEQKDAEAELAREAKGKADAERIRADRNAGDMTVLADLWANELIKSRQATADLEANEELNLRSLYALQLSKAAAICERDPKLALELLDNLENCPVAMRDYAWRYLRRLCQREEWAYHAHAAPVVAVAASADGALVATADQSGGVRLWSPRTRITYAILEGHLGRVNGVSFNAAGDSVATAGDDGTVRLWDLSPAFLELIREANRFLPSVPTEWISSLPGGIAYKTFKPSLTVKAFRDRARCVAFSSNGRTLAAGGSDTRGERADGLVRTWDLAGRSVSFPLASLVSAGAASGRYLQAKGSGVDVLNPGRVIRDHLRPVVALAFSPDGQVLVSGSEDASVQLTPMFGLSRPILLKLHGDTVYSLAFSPDGKTLATVNNTADPYIGLWDLTGRVPKERSRLTGHTRAIYSVAFGPDGKTIASAGFDRTVRLWDPESGEERGRLQGHTDAIRGLVFVPDQRTLVSVGNDKTARVWRLGIRKNDSGVLPSESPMTVSAAAISANGATLVTAEKTGTLRLWALDPKGMGGVPQAVVLAGNVAGPRGEARAVAVSPDGRFIVAAGDDGLIFWDNRGRGKRDPLPRALVKQQPCYALALGSDGATLAAATSDGVFLWDLRTGRKIREEAILPGGGVRALALSPSADPTLPPRRLAVGIDRNLTVIDLVSKVNTTRTHAHAAGIYSVEFDLDGEHLATGGDAGHVKTWTVTSTEKGMELEPRAEMTGHTDTVTALHFTRGGHSLISGGQDRTAIVWDPVTGQERALLTGHTDRIVELGISPRDGSLVSIGRDGTVKRWRAEE